MSEMIEDRPTADYVYSVHDDKESGKDVHIAMTANDKSDLEMYPDDIKEERQRAHETYLDRGREQTRSMENEQEQEQKHEHEHEHDRGNGRW